MSIARGNPVRQRRVPARAATRSVRLRRVEILPALRDEEPKSAEFAGNRRSKVVAGLIVAAMLACLGACAKTPATPAPGGSAEQPPGSFSVHIGGQMTSAVGVVEQ